MESLFLKIMNMSISAGWLIIAVIVLRLLFKKAPKWINCVLWGIVALRLVLPFSVESVFSLIPSKETLPQKIISGPSFDINSGIPVVDNTVNEYLGDRYFEGVTVPAGNGGNVMSVLSVVWLAGMMLLIAYAVISYVRIRYRVRVAVNSKDNIMLCDGISTPFILGVLRPKVYLPTAMNDEDTRYVIAHEKAHLKRKDHIWKPLGFALLAVYWFNPLVWVGYLLLCRDIELACDEKVIKELGEENKKSYSSALLNCSIPRRMISACPVAFGEVGVKKRIKSVLHYKKPAFWVVIAAVVVCVAVAVCFLTDPKPLNDKNAASDIGLTGVYNVGENVFIDVDKFTSQDVTIEPYYFINHNLLTWSVVGEQKTNENLMTDLGALSVVKLNEGNFDSYFKTEGIWNDGLSPKKLRKENQNAWSVVCKWNYNLFFYLMQQKNGDFYICRGFAEGGRTIGAVQKLTVDEGFCATVTEIEKTANGEMQMAIFVEPFVDEQLRKSGDKFRIVTSIYSFYIPDLKVGDELWIGWNGAIREIYPPEIVSVSSIFKLSQTAKKAEENGRPAFNAEVQEVYENTVVVKPFEGEDIGEGLILVGLSGLSDDEKTCVTVGTKLRIEYDGVLLYSYPAQIGGQYEVYILED